MNTDQSFWIISSIVCTFLLAFGIFYNRFVAWLERYGHDRGYMAFIVVAGVAVTGTGAVIIQAALTDLATALAFGAILLACFIASGLPMIWGSVTRHVQHRQRDERAANTLIQELPSWLQWLKGETDAETDHRGLHLPAGDQPGAESE
jgi:predicted PurR-regulated permease PerM